MVDIFVDDVVAILNKEDDVVHYGTVLKTQANNSSDEDEDENEDAYSESEERGNEMNDDENASNAIIRNTKNSPVDRSLSVICYPGGLVKNFGKSNILLLDRNLYPGSYVRQFVKDVDTQRGVIINSKIICDLKVPMSPFIIRNVDSSELLPLIPLYTDCDYVLLDSWVGKIDQIEYKSIILFGDGARCELSGEAHEELFGFDDINEKDFDKSEYEQSDFYEGQQLRGSMESFQQAHWLHSTYLHSNFSAKKHRKRKVTVTIEKTEVTKVEVIWLTCGYQSMAADSTGKMPSQPDRNITGDIISKLKVADMQSANVISIGEKYYLRLCPHHSIIPDSDHKSLKCFKYENVKGTNEVDVTSDEFNEIKFAKSLARELHSYHKMRLATKSSKVDILETKKDFPPPKRKASLNVNLTSIKSRKKRISQSAGETSNRFEASVKDLEIGSKVMVKVASKLTLVDVLWQDGSIERSVPSTRLYPIEYLDDLEFFPGNFVVMNSTEKNLGIDYGVVTKVDHLERTCSIAWLKANEEMCVQVDSEMSEVSVHDVKLYSEISYDIGSYVLLVDKPCMDMEDKHAVLGCVKFVKKNGMVLVSWFGGDESEVTPQQLFLLSILDDDTIDDDDDKSSGDYSSSNVGDVTNDDVTDDETSSTSWETEEENDSKSEKNSKKCLPPICQEFCCSLVHLMTVLKMYNFLAAVSYSFGSELKDFIAHVLKLIKAYLQSKKPTQVATINYDPVNVEDNLLHLAFLDSFNKNFELIEKLALKLVIDFSDDKFKVFLDKLATSFERTIPYENNDFFFNEIMNDDSIFRSVSINNKDNIEESVSSEKLKVDRVDDIASLTTDLINDKKSLLVIDINNRECVASQTNLKDENMDDAKKDDIASHFISYKTSQLMDNEINNSISVKSSISTFNNIIENDENLVDEISKDANLIVNTDNEEFFDCPNEIEVVRSICIATAGGNYVRTMFTKSNEKLDSFFVYKKYFSRMGMELVRGIDEEEMILNHENKKRFLDLKMLDVVKSFEINKFVYDEDFDAKKIAEDEIFSVISKFYKLLSNIDVSHNNSEWLNCIIGVIKNPENLDPMEDADEVLVLFKNLLIFCFKILTEIDESSIGALHHLAQLYNHKIFEEMITDFSWTTSVKSMKILLSVDTFKTVEFNNSYMIKLITTLINTILKLHEKVEKLETLLDNKVGFCNSTESISINDHIYTSIDAGTYRRDENNEIINGVVEGINLEEVPLTSPKNSASSIALNDKGVEGINLEEVPLTSSNDSANSIALNDKGVEGINLEEVPLTSPKDSASSIALNDKGFILLDEEPTNHHFVSTVATNPVTKTFLSALHKDHKLLKSCLPVGIYVKAFLSRIDLFTAMIVGPQHTPYEDGLFFFDIHLPSSYPQVPPKFHYLAYCADRLNPNLYEDGKVCVSLLGTWSGKGTEVWSNKTSNLLQVLVSIQGLILNSEPYFNEAGFERLKGCQEGRENSRMYNEMAIIKLLQSTNKMLEKPCLVFKEETFIHFNVTARRLIRRHEIYLKYENKKPSDTEDGALEQSETKEINLFNHTTSISTSNAESSKVNDIKGKEKVKEIVELPAHIKPEFPLLPISKGFRIALDKYLSQLKESFGRHNIPF